ncbi:MAG TPA: DUF2807 domain-containing protein, partial [Bacteroidota bacterium]|nr:DUF2807 domain-containing protein [Bacteroidota bacterium]
MRYSAVKFLALGTVALLIFTGCRLSANGHRNDYHGSGRMITETRTVGECEGITLQNQGNVYLTQDDNQSIRIEADDNIMGKVIVERRHGILVVGLKDGDYSDVTLKVYVSMKHINSLSIEGAGTIECSNRIETE